MTLNNCCIVGMIKLVLYDSRPNSPTNGNLMELFIGEDNYCLVQIPPGVTNGYKAYGSKMAMLANCATMPHDKNELIYIDTIYNPLETKTFKFLKEEGRKVFNGLEMFIYQGQKSFYLWNKINPEIDNELVELLNSKLK